MTEDHMASSAPAVVRFLHTAYYFGCHQRPGHYLYAPQMRSPQPHSGWHDRMEHLDGALAPEGPEIEFRAKAWRLTGYTPAPYSAISWWDRSVDRRGKCNSIIFAPGHTVEAEGILHLAHEHFPQVMGRLPQIELLPGWHEKTRPPPQSKA